MCAFEDKREKEIGIGDREQWERSIVVVSSMFLGCRIGIDD
jgi:hypothetical protein